MTYLVQTHQLTKSIGGQELVKDVNLHVKKGEIYGFVGPNGAGKTTVLRLLTNLWKPTSGTVELFGEVVTPKSYEPLKRIGCNLEFPTFYEHLTGFENRELHREYMGYYEPDSIPRVLELLGLMNAAKKRVGEYSLGMKERLGIARAILSRPELLLLDEPTNGLDPAGIKQIRDLLKRLCTEYGMTVLLSSHILSEVESMADTIGVIQHGRLRTEIGKRELEERNLEYIELSVRHTERAAYVLSDKLGLMNFKVMTSDTEREGTEKEAAGKESVGKGDTGQEAEGSIRVYDGRILPEELSRALILNGVEVKAIRRKTESLEDYFLKLTKETEGRSRYVEAD